MATTIITALLNLAAGIGVFLIAIKIMSTNLESVSGNKLKTLFAKTSKSKLLGVGIGTVSTAAIQSSGAVSVMTIGFVNAGLMTLMQAATIIFGANIGTTITGQIVALGLFGENTVSTTVIFSAFAGIGAFMMYFGKKDIVKKIGGILAGFGMLFVGLSAMSNSMSEFAQLPAVTSFLAKINFPGYSIVLVLVGAALTALIQSSSVMTSVAITMVFTGLIGLDQGIYLTMGSNIGSCVVAVLACIGSSTNSKRTALIHLIFNITGVIVFLLIGTIMDLSTHGAITFGSLFNKMFPSAPQTQLAMFHTIFNVLTVICVLPATNLLVKLVIKMLPDKKLDSEKEDSHTPKLAYIDEHFLSTPPIAVAQIRNEVVSMAELAMKNFNFALDTVCSLDFSRAEEFKINEEKLNFLNREITRYIVKLSKADLSESDNVYVSTVFHSVSDLERIGDYAENIMEYAEKLQSIGKGFSDEAVAEIRALQRTIDQLYQKVMKVYINSDFKTLKEAYAIEDKVDEMTNAMADQHILRLDNGICSPDVGAPYLSLSSNAERVADHFINIAKAVRTFSKKSKDNTKGLGNDVKEHKNKHASKAVPYTTPALDLRELIENAEAQAQEVESATATETHAIFEREALKANPSNTDNDNDNDNEK